MALERFHIGFQQAGGSLEASRCNIPSVRGPSHHPASSSKPHISAPSPATQSMQPVASQEPQGTVCPHTYTAPSPSGSFLSLPTRTRICCSGPHVDTLHLPGPCVDTLTLPGSLQGHTYVTGWAPSPYNGPHEDTLRYPGSFPLGMVPVQVHHSTGSPHTHGDTASFKTQNNINYSLIKAK
jgi:hypothetical protein